MSIISVFTFEKLPSVYDVCKILNSKSSSEIWITAKVSKYNKNEVFIQYWFYEELEESLKKVFSENTDEIVSFLKQNGKTQILKRVYCFINTLTRTLEIYRGPDLKTQEILTFLEKLLKVKLAPLNLNSEELKKIYSKHSIELKQAMFQNIEGLIFEILRGNYLENNKKFQGYLQEFPEALRAISFRPKIKFLNSNNRYQVTINGNKGTIRFSSINYMFQWRPRFEIRQIIFIVAAIAGLLQTFK